MSPEDVLAVEPKILTQTQREFYFENGYFLPIRFTPTPTRASIGATWI